MKISWRVKITITIIATVIGAIGLTWVLNKTLLETYYLNKKIDTLCETYDMVSEILSGYYVDGDMDVFAKTEPKTSYSVAYMGYKKPTVSQTPRVSYLASETDSNRVVDSNTNPDHFLNEEDTLKVEKECARNNLSVFVVWNFDYYFSTENEFQKDRIMFDRNDSLFSSHNRFNLENSEKVYNDPDGRYFIVMDYDKRTSSNYMNLFAEDIRKGQTILLRTSVESIQESVEIANSFLLIAGVSVAAAAAFIMFDIGGRTVRPVRKLSYIAKRMSELDFTIKYEGNANDEIGELGQSINTLSRKLESTISDLKSANNRLESDIEQKTQIDELRKEFLSNVTHELKTPIALISGYAEGLKCCINDDAESREFYCDVIMDEANKMNEMVKQLLTLNSIEFGKQTIELERFDISEMIHGVIERSDVLFKSKDINVLCNVPDGLFAWADEFMMEEVFTNYITNAVNHVNDEKVVDIRAERIDDTIRISVFNTGEPIPEDEIDKIWIKFYKVDKARTREYSGSGIGLSIVKAIMEAHNKPFGVCNHSNGVEFWFEVDAKV